MNRVLRGVPAPRRDAPGEDEPPETPDAPDAGGAAAASWRRPGLLVLSGHTSAPRAPFVIVVMGLLSAGLVSLLVLNTSLDQGAFQLRDLQQKSTQLSDQTQALQQKIQDESAPEQLSASAQHLGLVPPSSLLFLDPATGRTYGQPPSISSGSSR